MVTDLSKRMSRRSTPEELTQKHILPAETAQHSVSSNILQAKQALEQEKAKNTLNRKLSLRPTKDDLRLRNIIKASNENIASNVVSTSPDSAASSSPSLSYSSSTPNYTLDVPKTFEKKQETLKSILKKRPEKSQLQDMHILKGSDINMVESLEKERKYDIENKLTAHLRDRPDPSSLKNSKILFFSDEIEVCSTYKKTEYNRKPDDDLTFKRLTPALKTQIREELNQFKKTEMVVHEDSVQNTCFHWE